MTPTTNTLGHTQHRTTELGKSTESLVEQLDRTTAGAVLTPGHPGFAEAALAFNLATEHRPDALLVAESVADMVAAVRLAANHGLTVAVQATGHGAAPAGSGTILICTGKLDTVSIDPVARTATVGAGTSWQQVLDAGAPYGLAGLSGSAPGVGVVGYTVGGGLGPVARTYGFAADHVRSLQLVTAAGDLIEVDAEHDPDRFWAIRGGGAAYGIVTSLTFDLFPISTLYAGALWFSADVSRTVLHRWREWTAELPETISTSIARLNLPPVPDLPEPLRGQAVIVVRFAAVGDPAEAARCIAPLRSAATPLLDTIGELPYPAIGAIHADPTAPVPVWERGALLRELPVEAAEAFLDITSPAAGLPIMMAELRLLGGAVSRNPQVPNAVGGRDAAYSLHAIGVLAPPIAAAVPGAVRAVIGALTPWSTGGAMMNFAGAAGSQTSAAIRLGLRPPAESRLVALRTAMDPDGVFAPAARWSADEIHLPAEQ